MSLDSECQADTALLETDIVVRLCSDLAAKGPGYPNLNRRAKSR